MDVTIDDYGRIVIPKPVRDQLGLQSGTSLELAIQTEGESEEKITLSPKRQAPPLQQKGSLLVHTGELSDDRFDITDHLSKQRQTRALKQAGLET